MLKRFVSLTLFWSAIILFISSIVLFIEPHGRVAFWADWRFLGITKNKWDDIHICSGALFLIAALFHIYLNWSLIIAYFTRKVKEIKPASYVFTSLALTLFVCITGYFNIPPMKQFLELNEAIKQAHTKKYGNPPFGHAELVPISKLAQFLGINANDFVTALKESGIKEASPNISLKKLSQKYHKSPSQLFEIAMQNLKKKQHTFSLPDTPPPGTGMLTIKDIAKTYHVPEKTLLKRLQQAGISPSPDATLKEIAENAGTTPHEIYEVLKNEN